mmetsp:Transcript_9947/g.20559  ORF Transcript_9947/g.20559 Transcript_9947/m.20559 type:complete len:93 (+) Transcript_9947:338-616(+)
MKQCPLPLEKKTTWYDPVMSSSSTGMSSYRGGYTYEGDMTYSSAPSSTLGKGYMPVAKGKGTKTALLNEDIFEKKTTKQRNGPMTPAPVPAV